MLSADDLRFFLEVARTRRLVSAARNLGVDHTTVSRRVSNLERAVGRRLFDRFSSGWVLTDAGGQLVTHAEAIESRLLAAAEDLGSAGGRLSGSLRIVAPDAFGSFVLAEALPEVRRRHPRLAIEMVTASGVDMLATREFDIGVSLEKPRPRGVDVESLASYTLGLYATADYLRWNPVITSLSDLRRHTVIGYIDSLLDIPALRNMRETLDGVQPMVRATSITSQWLSAVGGHGVAILPEFVAERDRRLVRILRTGVSVRRNYWLVIPHELRRLARVQLGRAALLRLVQRHPYLSEGNSDEAD
ncbi:LysR family transcriptional regulator [Rhodococcus sp. NPDC057529]|uniref:LysR family transcriptional regulator n=1 Tax=Rhodococcus sp. NPDC057529 TaxID=3346158 RepID=UPI00366F8C8A